MPFATFSRNPLVSNRFTHFFHQPHYALSFYAPYMTIPASVPVVLASHGFFPYIRTDI